MDNNQKLTMQLAVTLLGQDIDTQRNNVNIPCPICAKGREKKLNINFQKDTFHCPKCDVGGYPINYWGLFRLGDPHDLKKAALDYYKFIDEKSDESKSTNLLLSHPSPLKKRIDLDVESVDVRNKTYSELLNLLTLSENHAENLYERGLSLDEIAKNGYKSYPLTGLSNIARILLDKGCILSGVPGFYTDKSGKWTMLRQSSGILIPQRDGFDRIQGFQIRLDNSEKGRYRTLSTGGNYANGAQGAANIHLAKDLSLEEIIITEGPLKGDIIKHFTGYSVLALQGVNSLSRLPQVLCSLKEKGTKSVMIAYDMDIRENEMVKKAYTKLTSILEELELPYSTLFWDQKYKGLDDWLKANK